MACNLLRALSLVVGHYSATEMKALKQEFT